METIAQKVRSARRRADLRPVDLARLADVPASTVSRAEAGKIVPSAETYLRLLRAAGFADDGERLTPLSRPSATWAARWLVGDLPSEPPGAREWAAAWYRMGLVDESLAVLDAESLLFRAGRSAVLGARPRAVTASSSMGVAVIAERLEGIDYAVTGDEALERLGSSIIGTWPVVYVAELRAAVEALGVSPRLPGEAGARITLVEFDGFSELGRTQAEDGVWFASPLQAVIDCYGGYGRMIEQAQVVVGTWLDAVDARLGGTPRPCARRPGCGLR